MVLAVGSYNIQVTATTESGNVTASASGTVTILQPTQAFAEVSTPTLVSGNRVIAASEVSQPSIGQIHNLAASDVSAASEVSSPDDLMVELAANSLQAPSEITTPNWATSPAIDELTSSNVEVTSEVSTPVLTDITDNLTASSIASTTQVGAPILSSASANLNAVAAVSNSQVGIPSMDVISKPILERRVPNQSSMEGDYLNFDIAPYFSKVDSYTISGLPTGTGLSLASSTGVLKGALTADDVGYHTLTVTATNSEGSTSTDFGLTVLQDETTADRDWPASLPQSVLIDGFESEVPEGSIRVDMDSGPAFQRQRYTAAPEQFAAEFIMTIAQYKTFMNFYKTSTAHGALPFNWKHPITGDPTEVRFVVGQQPSYEILSGTLLRVSATFEVLP
jgi:hypothetical protein